MIEGINPDERVFFRIGCSYQKFNGELVLTDKGIVFLKASGLFGTGRERMHYFTFVDIHGLRAEKKGLFTNFIALDHRSLSWGNRTYRYSCSHQDVVDFLGAFELQNLYLKTPEEIEELVLNLVKPKGEADLAAVSRHPRIKELVRRLHGKTHTAISDTQSLDVVKKAVIRLISKGNLDGIITEENRYISNVMLARKTVQYLIISII